MIYVEAPQEIVHVEHGPKLFLAGGITGCPDWQKIMKQELNNEEVTIINPRRENFPIHDPNAALAQITWEFEMLRKADMISFWFPSETICPIVLYELGQWNMTDKKIIVGCAPGYTRLQDVEIQTNLARPEVQIHKFFNVFIEAVIREIKIYNEMHVYKEVCKP